MSAEAPRMWTHVWDRDDDGTIRCTRTVSFAVGECTVTETYTRRGLALHTPWVLASA